MKVQIYFFNLEIRVNVSRSALMQRELHLLDPAESSTRICEAKRQLSTVMADATELLRSAHILFHPITRQTSSRYSTCVG